MAEVLPRFVALKSHYNQKYMVPFEFSDPNPMTALRPSGENMNSPDAMFQVEISHQNNKMVNIKCCRNNKYLRRRSNDYTANYSWINAEADNVDENTSSWTCTNFVVVPVGGGGTNTFQFRHVQLGGHYLGPHNNIGGLYQALLCVSVSKTSTNSNPNTGGPIFDFTVIDLEPLFALPRFVAFKSSFNQKHLQPVDPPQQQSTIFVKSSGDLAITPFTKFQVVESNKVKGMVHIKCCHNNKYLCRQDINKSSEFWIVADAEKPEEDVYNWMCTLFRPVQVNAEAKTFRLRHPRLANYVRISVDAAAVNANRQFCLNAYSAQPAEGQQILADVFTATVWEEPTMALPRFVAFKSSHNQKYLQHYEFEGSLLRGSAEKITSPYTKYEVEASKKVEEMVHIRCCHTKRYWRRRTQNDSWLVAEAHIPDEDLSNWTCTLFNPVQVDATAKTFRLRHVQLQHYASLFENVADTNRHLCLYAQQKDPAQQSLVDVFTAIDWQPIPKPKPKPDPKPDPQPASPSVLPKYAAFKGDNGKYLSATMIQGHPHLQFNSNNKEDPLCRNEVIVYPDNTIRIRNVHYNKYWKPQNNWIFVHGEIPPKPSSLFHLIRISGNVVIALRSDQNKRICIRSIEGQKENCLYSGADTLTKEAHLQVEELNLD